MRYWTEDNIKDALDGTFTRVLYDGRVVTEVVDDGPNVGGRPKGYKASKPQYPYTQAEDELLWSMRLRNMPFSEIAWVIGRSEESAKNRYRALRVRGRV